MEKLDNTLTFLLKSNVSAYEFSAFPNEMHHQHASEYILICIYLYTTVVAIAYLRHVLDVHIVAISEMQKPTLRTPITRISGISTQTTI